ncbi:hypothetical protein V8C34DRAFT_292164, partial [Trichoderma compactum]
MDKAFSLSLSRQPINGAGRHMLAEVRHGLFDKGPRPLGACTCKCSDSRRSHLDSSGHNGQRRATGDTTGSWLDV